MHLANVLIRAFERGSVSICQAVLIWGGTPRPAQGGCLRWCRRTDRSFRVAVCDFHENSIKHTCLVALVSGDTLRMPASGGLLPLGARGRRVRLQSLCAAFVRRLLASVHANIGRK
jgi:hypothetical protein